MKLYPKTYEDVFKYKGNKNVLADVQRLSSVFGDLNELEDLTREHLRSAYKHLFDDVIRYMWLRRNFAYNGRRFKYDQNGFHADVAYSNFLKFKVGTSQHLLSSTWITSNLISYVDDFFPEFLERNPFEEPEYYEFPYKNITLEYLHFVCQMTEHRIWLLNYAEEHNLSFGDFGNFVVNQALNYNEDLVAQGKDPIYEISKLIGSPFTYIKRIGYGTKVKTSGLHNK